ncbi:MAG TPA: hypothetical protein VMS88_06480 [Terriglobales bacterium]|nr:hypothetical protein [Terriglobales bacterium]
MVSESALGPEDRALLDRVAVRIADLHLEVPALLTLESVRPLSRVAGQAMIFFEPFLQVLLRPGDSRRFASLLQRPDGIDALASRIEDHANARRARTRGPERTRAGGGRR